MDVQIDNQHRRLRIPSQMVRKTVRAALDVLANPEAELSLVLTDDETIAALNRQYLNRRGPTNVLAFPMQEGPFAGVSPGLLGDVVISLDTAGREAAAGGMTLEERFTQLLVHGILHLAGYDHEQSPDEARIMEAASRKILQRLAEA